MSIVDNNMLVNVHIGTWTGQKRDKDRSRRVTEEAGAADDAASVNKHILPKDVFKPIDAAKMSVYNHFRESTLPWKDNGDRLLPRTLYHDFINTHGELREKFYQAVKYFLEQVYPSARARAEFRMGDMFNPNDYPDQKVIEKKFYIKLDLDSVTTADDFRVALDMEDQARVKEAIEESMNARVNEAMRDVWQRLGNAMEHFVDRMAPDTKFREATLENLEELVSILPSLNIMNDPDLAAFGADISARLTGLDAKDLRKNEAYRTKVHNEASKIMSRMSSFMNAMGDSND